MYVGIWYDRFKLYYFNENFLNISLIFEMIFSYLDNYI